MGSSKYHLIQGPRPMHRRAMLAFVCLTVMVTSAAHGGARRFTYLAVAMGVIADDVRNGRMIYIDNCARCHRPEAVTRYTETQWQKILPWMSDQAQLSPEDAAAVKAYVLITLRAAARVTDDNARTPATTAPADP